MKGDVACFAHLFVTHASVCGLLGVQAPFGLGESESWILDPQIPEWESGSLLTWQSVRRQLVTSAGSFDLSKSHTLMIVRLMQLVSASIGENIIPVCQMRQNCFAMKRAGCSR